MTAPDHAALCERLRRHLFNRPNESLVNPDGPEAAAAIERLAAENAAMRVALKPFAECAKELDGCADLPRAPDGEWAKFRLLTDDYRRARTALKGAADDR